MGATIWSGDTIISSTANADDSYKEQSFTATAGQTLFTLTEFAYQVGTGSLQIYINGARQRITSDFTETSNSSVTLTSGVEAGDIVVIAGLVGGTAAQAAAGSAQIAVTAQAAAEQALADITALSLPSLPASDQNVLVRKADGNFDKISNSTAGKVLTSNGPGAAPTFQTPDVTDAELTAAITGVNASITTLSNTVTANRNLAIAYAICF